MSFEFPGETFVFPAEEPIEAEAVIDNSGNAAVSVRLSSSVAKTFGAVTTRHVSETGILRICGEEVLQARLMSPILAGIFVISDHSATDAARIVERLTAGRCNVAGDG